jgi:transcriptional regulator NrdR family protein
MVCPHCNASTDVVNSRKQRRLNTIWRRRKCTGCGSIFTTLEGADLQSALRVAHSATELEPFSRDKLFISIYESCKHRATALQDAANLTQQVISYILATQAQPGLIEHRSLAQATHNVLKTFDDAAAAYYGAYHLR